MAMGYDFMVFRQDLNAAVNSLQSEDFTNTTVFSNRIMSNALFGSERKLALVGFFLRDVSLVIGGIRARAAATPFSTALSLTKTYASGVLEKTKDPNFSEDDLWILYHDFHLKIRQVYLTSTEQNVYSETNVAFTRESFKWLLSYLESHANSLLHQKSLLVKGITNEMNRIYWVHGGDLEETYCLSLMTALDRCNDYVKFISGSQVTGPQGEYQERIEKDILPYVKKVVALLRDGQPNKGDVNEVVWELTRRWREYFLEFMEQRTVSIQPIYQPEKGIELPEETRDKLTKAITTSLEEEIKSKK